MMAGILKIVRYSVGEMRPMAATALQRYAKCNTMRNTILLV